MVQALWELKRDSGTSIHLDLEPEPDGLLENSREVVHFFKTRLFKEGARRLARSLGMGKTQAHQAVLDHLQVCFDTCHMAVEYEDSEEVLQSFEREGIKIGKVQISSALHVPFDREGRRREKSEKDIRRFADSVYLHQVKERNRLGFASYPDLPEALKSIGKRGIQEWRIHFHVPLFVEKYGTSILPGNLSCKSSSS